MSDFGCKATHKPDLVCHGRHDGHKGMHHDWLARVYWLVRTDGTTDYLAEGPRT